ncbi:MAG: M28 family peptidase [Flavobacteriales bacterium]
MKNPHLLAALLLPLSVAAQQPTTAVPQADPVVAKARGYIGDLCSPDMFGRGYVQGGDSLAAEYLAAKFKALGAEPVRESYFEPFTFNVNSFPNPIYAVIDGMALQPGVDFIVGPNSGKASGNFGIAHITPQDLSPENAARTYGVISGKAVHFNVPATKDPDSLALFAKMERELMYYAPVIKRTSGKLTWSVAHEALPYPLIEVLPEAITDSAETIDLRIKNKLIRDHHARNVWGWVKGKKPGKGTVIISAHFDHLGLMGDALFPGANDNASGVAMLLTLMERFVKEPPDHNVFFIAFAGEEAGLEGSTWCVADRPIEWNTVRLMLNLDIMGTGDDGIMVVNATVQEDEFALLTQINTDKPRLVDIKSRGPACNSDHCPFVQKGIPAIFIYTLGGIAAYHDVNDKPETLPLTDFADIHATLFDFVQALK